MSTRFVSATDFKAKCLSLLDDVSEGRFNIIVTKRGRPVATVTSAHESPLFSSEGMLKGKVHIPDELLMADMSDLWEVVREKKISRG